MIKDAYIVACFLRFPSLFAEALKTITFYITIFRILTHEHFKKKTERIETINSYRSFSSPPSPHPLTASHPHSCHT